MWIQVRNYYICINYLKIQYNGCNLIVPLCAPVQFTQGNRYKHSKSISPYILGALIGDGCLTDTVVSHNGVQLTTMDEEIVEQFVRAGYDMKNCQTKPGNKAKSYVLYDIKLVQSLRGMGLAGHDASSKFIPEQYKHATIEERKELMQGLMDTDGYVDDRGHLSYSTISPQLAEDVAFLVRSLGGKATVRKNKAGYKDKSGNRIEYQDIYNIYIMTRFDPELMRLTRKKCRCRYEFNSGNSELGKRIVKIKLIGRKEGRCITVDEPGGLYVADDFTVTHNSYLGSVWLFMSSPCK